MANLYDQYLLFRIRTKRDKEAFGKLYDRYVKAIYRFVLLKLPTKQAAEDVTADTFLRCWQYLQEQNQVSNIRALLYKVARNLVIDSYRKAEHRDISLPLTFEIDVTSDDANTSSYNERQSGVDMSDRARQKAQIEARADLQLILNRITQLKEDYRDVLTLRLIDDLAFGDIADILDKTSGNVRVIYHRAMKALEQLENS